MSLGSLGKLILLAAIWGASYLFMRISAPAMGAVFLVELRVTSAALFLAAVALIFNRRFNLRQNWRPYLILGGLNAALPFCLFAYAAQTLSASMMSILNATTPIWGALVGALIYRHKLSANKLIGMLLGMTGVTILVGYDPVLLTPGALPAILAVLGATLCYGLGSTYAQAKQEIGSFNIAHGSLWGAGTVLLPFLALSSMPGTPTHLDIASVLTLGVLCTGVAYIVFFGLIRDIGAPSTLTVTYLIPVFGVFWGAVFLDEQLGWHTLAGSIVVLLGTALATGLSLPKSKPRSCAEIE